MRGKTKRTPRHRRSRPPITPRALALFAQMHELEAQCTRSDDLECSACEKWHELGYQLHHELRLRPWELAIPVWPDDGDGSFCWRQAHQRYVMLAAALSRQ
jgi:hypothetical protein